MFFKRFHLMFFVVFIVLLFSFWGTALAVTYTVKPGDSLYSISQGFGVSAEDIRNHNGLGSTTIYPGQQLQIPTGETIYTVKPGDSLYLIAQKFGVTVTELKTANGLTASDIRAGQQLVIPSGGSGSVAASGTYVVRAGDTLDAIGKRFGVPYREIMRANGLTSTTITVGQKLTIPSNSQPSSASRSDTASSRTRDGISAGDLNLLAHLVYGEARGEPYKGQVAVAAVVLNRVKHSSFPNTISGVIYQTGAFDVVRDGQLYLDPDTIAIQAARDAANGWDPSGGAIYYWNPATATSQWIWSRPITTQIGNHIFAK